MREPLFFAEIHEQPATLERLLAMGRRSIESAAERIRAFAPEWVLIAARGTSDNAARYAQYLLGAHNRLGVALAVPSLCTLYGAPPAMRRALVVGISQSGQSPDVVAVVEEARRQGAATLAITNDPGSPLATTAESCLRLAAGEERAVAATKTYTAELLAIAMLSAALEGNPARWHALEALPALVERAIRANEALGPGAARLADARRFLVIGRGFNYATAFELALKIKETTGVIAEAYSIADLLHGPVAMIDEGFPVIVVGPSGRAYADVPELLALLAERRARLIAIGDRDELLEKAELALRMPPDVPEWLSPIVAIAPGQLLAGAMAVARGLDPDRPRGLSKVTLTR